ncbi:MAG TPA: chemotaxis protein CheW [Pyrinomonadaceae bacterium]|jgi:purine-binding chemotaxis protein CheW|nr:chemotaxis protein CheW [Pyrinomonadaceae bacterium]
MHKPEQLTVFRLDEQRYAVPLTSVERVVRAAELTLLPNAPGIVLGIIDVSGSVLPVINLRRRFDLPEREIRADDHFLIARLERRTVVLPIDEAEGVIDVAAAEIVNAGQIAKGIRQFSGVAKLADGLVLIHDLESFLSLDEERILDEAMHGELSGA